VVKIPTPQFEKLGLDEKKKAFSLPNDDQFTWIFVDSPSKIPLGLSPFKVTENGSYQNYRM